MIFLKPKRKTDDFLYLEIIRPLIENDQVRSMDQYVQHGEISCLDHSLYVSYTSFLICRRLGLDYSAAARGGLLHDFFLYDWHAPKATRKGWHAFTHPYAALENAEKHFEMSARERDIIIKHMWPVTLAFPRYRESYIVMLIDKYCAVMETFAFWQTQKILAFQRLLAIPSAF